MTLPTPTALPEQVSELNATLYVDIPYRGSPRSTFDFYKPIGGLSVKPFVIYMHGGGFIQGDKTALVGSSDNRAVLEALIAADISVLAVNYELIATDGTELVGVAKCIACMHVAIKTIRFNSIALALDKSKMGYYGRSAGGGMGLFFCGEDYSEPNMQGTLWAESTRPIALATYRPQSYNIPAWGDYFDSISFADILAIPGFSDAVYGFYGMPPTATPTVADFNTKKNKNLAERLDVIKRVEPLGIALYIENYNLTDDPTNYGDLIHHPVFSQSYIAKWVAAGAPSEYYTTFPPAVTPGAFLVNALTA
jgi:hypothetical protein